VKTRDTQDLAILLQDVRKRVKKFVVMSKKWRRP